MSIDYSNRLTYAQWKSLLNELRTLTEFFLIGRSCTNGLKLVYVLVRQSQLHIAEDAIHFTVTKDKVSMEVLTKKDSVFKNFVEVLFEKSLKEMPKYLNDTDVHLQLIAIWRLKNNICTNLKKISRKRKSTSMKLSWQQDPSRNTSGGSIMTNGVSRNGRGCSRKGWSR